MILFVNNDNEMVTICCLCQASFFDRVLCTVLINDLYIVRRYFHYGRYIMRYAVENLVLQGHARGAIKRDFRTYMRRYTSPNENFEYGYPHSDALLQFCLNLSIASHKKTARYPMICDELMESNYF